MKIDTRIFGEMTVASDKILNVPSGILGFPNSKNFVIIEKEDAYPFYWLQSVDEPSLAFAMMNPFFFKPDYSLNLAPIFELMEWAEDAEENAKVYVIINAADPLPENITANLQAPIIMNAKRGEAVQMVIHDSPYSHRYPVFGEAESR